MLEHQFHLVFQNADMDYLSVNLRIEPIFLKETFNLHWVSEAGIIDNINRVVEEYKLLRLLRVRDQTNYCMFSSSVLSLGLNRFSQHRFRR